MAETQRRQSRMGRLNDRIAVLIAVMAVLSAVPVASARPSLWLLWSGLIAALAGWWLWRAGRIAPRRPLRMAGFLPLLGLALLVPAFAVLQSLPLAGGLPDVLTRMRPGMEELRGQAISVLPGASWLGAVRFTAWLILLALVIEVTTRRDRMLRMSWILFIGITLQAIWALAALQLLGDIALFGEKQSYQGAATGSFVNRNSLATFLGFGLVLGATLLGRRLGQPAQRQSRLPGLAERLGAGSALVLVSMLLIALALVATQSRLGSLAALAGLAVTTLSLLLAHRRLSPRTGLILFGACLAAAALLLLLGQDGLSERLLLVERSGDERLTLYRQILGMIAVRPLTGFGFDAFGPAYEAFRAPPLNTGVHYDLAHNSYLALWAELGLVVGSIPPVLLAVCGILLWHRLRAGEDFPAAAAAGLGALVLAAVHSLADFSLEIPANVFVFVVILGMGLARRSRPAEPPPLPPTPASPEAGPGARLALPPRPEADRP
ncbi:O-antigen ligase family protein [Pseudogemmobacter sonorensis]|uniref:O-antigen ligase family protein n=1 Tax=Pseudogemmobacter sonorensis TaxID=2989681 RepID=UPI0036A1A24C